MRGWAFMTAKCAASARDCAHLRTLIHNFFNPCIDATKPMTGGSTRENVLNQAHGPYTERARFAAKFLRIFHLAISSSVYGWIRPLKERLPDVRRIPA